MGYKWYNNMYPPTIFCPRWKSRIRGKYLFKCIRVESHIRCNSSLNLWEIIWYRIKIFSIISKREFILGILYHRYWNLFYNGKLLQSCLSLKLFVENQYKTFMPSTINQGGRCRQLVFIRKRQQSSSLAPGQDLLQSSRN